MGTLWEKTWSQPATSLHFHETILNRAACFLIHVLCFESKHRDWHEWVTHQMLDFLCLIQLLPNMVSKSKSNNLQISPGCVDFCHQTQSYIFKLEVFCLLTIIVYKSCNVLKNLIFDPLTLPPYFVPYFKNYYHHFFSYAGEIRTHLWWLSFRESIR